MVAIWTRAKARAREKEAGGGKTEDARVYAETTAVLRREFAASLTGIVHQADAETIAASLHGKGR